MHGNPMILPLDPQGKFCALQDEHGQTIGTGTREVCEILLYMITKASSTDKTPVLKPQRPHVRSAITI